ncbi:hypothetical protein C8A03DRAFT_44443 [Achaetomium macrosporum]|uniref:DUF8021 domain-containing protein n=1 Tax=Achaetomium macrosporum TaxID=79813 RepID=A0AAN7HDN7_9PEZI|nr:hypothetical protein C8A03DRAFT_44443 [Achaetomium macrosporum]
MPGAQLLLRAATLLTLLLPSTQAQSTRCQWASLRSATDAVLESLSSGTLSASVPSSNFTYTQNLHAMDISAPASILSTPLSAAYTHSIIDQDACAAFVKLVINSTSSSPNSTGTSPQENENKPILLGMHLHYTYTPSTGAALNTLNLVAAGPQDWQMGVAPTTTNITNTLLTYLQHEAWPALSRAKQDSRAILQSIAESYLNFLAGNSTSTTSTSNETVASVPWGRPCSRLEGAMYTAIADSERCDKGIVTFQEGPGRGLGVTERSAFVVDESVGAVSVLARDGRLHDAASVFEMRVVEGGLRYVHQFASLAG